MTPDRWIVVDNADPNISYSGGWINSVDNSQGNVRHVGPPYLDTLYTTLQSATASFQFSGTVCDHPICYDEIKSLEFLGTAVEVWGTTVADATTMDLQCFVDDTDIGREELPQIAANNQRLCGKIDLSDGTHHLRIEVTIGSTAPLFWIDQIRYIPSSNFPLDNQVILIENTDPAVRLDAQTQWATFDGIANITYESGSRPLAVVTFTGGHRKGFYTNLILTPLQGVSISWFGLIPVTSPQGVATSGSWSIDGGHETSFNLYALPSTVNSTLHNQQYFTTPDYPMGLHNLTVNYGGSQETTPFCLDYLYVKNGTFAANNSTRTSNTGPGGGILVAAIVGGVLGAVAILGLAVTLLFLRRRRRRLSTARGSPGTTKPTQFPLYRNGSDEVSSNASPYSPSSSSASAYTTIPIRAYQAVGMTNRGYNPWHFWSMENGECFPETGLLSRTIMMVMTDRESMFVGLPTAVHQTSKRLNLFHIQHGTPFVCYRG